MLELIRRLRTVSLSSIASASVVWTGLAINLGNFTVNYLRYRHAIQHQCPPVEIQIPEQGKNHDKVNF